MLENTELLPARQAIYLRVEEENNAAWALLVLDGWFISIKFKLS